MQEYNGCSERPEKELTKEQKQIFEHYKIGKLQQAY